MLLAVDLCLKGEDRPMVDVGRIPRFVLAVLLLLALLQRGYSRFSKSKRRERASQSKSKGAPLRARQLPRPRLPLLYY